MAARFSGFSESESGPSEPSSSEITMSGSWPISSAARRDSSSGSRATVARTISRSASSWWAKWASAGTEAVGLLPVPRVNSVLVA
eukprot:7385634-Alexandrium_andersonii.AAC.1